MDLSNNPFCLEDLQTIRSHVQLHSMAPIFYDNLMVFEYEKLKTTHQYIISVVLSSYIGRDKSSIIIFDKTTNSIVAEYHGEDDIDSIARYLYYQAKELNCKILISRNGFGTNLLAKLIDTDIKESIIYKEKEATVEERLKYSSVAAGIDTKIIKQYGYYETASVRKDMNELLKLCVELDNTEDADKIIISPFIFHDIMNMVIPKTGRIDLTNKLKSFLAGFAYIIKKEDELRW